MTSMTRIEGDAEIRQYITLRGQDRQVGDVMRVNEGLLLIESIEAINGGRILHLRPATESEATEAGWEYKVPRRPLIDMPEGTLVGIKRMRR